MFASSYHGFVFFFRQFIRISDDTDAEDVLRLLQEEWKLDLPKLVISVAGGGKNFFMHPKLKDLFRQGMLKVLNCVKSIIDTLNH